MSMITEQVKRLRDAANRFDAEGAEPSDGDLMREAANTIEILSAKVQAANMERSTTYYNGGWIFVKERLPENGKEVLTCSNGGFIEIQSLEESYGSYWENQHGDWSDLDEIIKWMPLPKSYEAENEV